MARSLDDALERYDLDDPELAEFSEAVRVHFEAAYEADFPDPDPESN
jgi:hypothetical protein